MSDNSKGNTKEPRIETNVTPTLKPSQQVISSDYAEFLRHPVNNFESRNNEYVLIEVDKEGREKQGTEFTVGQTTYQTSFANNPNFIVKKNPS